MNVEGKSGLGSSMVVGLCRLQIRGGTRWSWVVGTDHGGDVTDGGERWCLWRWFVPLHSSEARVKEEEVFAMGAYGSLCFLLLFFPFFWY